MQRTFHISHTTTYDFDRAVSGIDVTARLRPPVHCAQRPVHASVTVVPAVAPVPEEPAETGDRFRITAPLNRLKVIGQSTVVHDPDIADPIPAPPQGAEPPAETDADHPLIVAWAGEVLQQNAPSLDDVRRFIDRLNRDFVFDPAATTRTTGLIDFFTGCRGVCEDFARLATACLRARGIPVRHVVGYLLPRSGQGSTFGRHAHAWISVWYPDVGWVDLDPTTGLTVPDHHITLIRGYDRDDTLPVTGRFAHGESVGQRVSVDVSIVSA